MIQQKPPEELPEDTPNKSSAVGGDPMAGDVASPHNAAAGAAPKTDAGQDKEQRLAEALRANLRRRRNQKSAREST